MACSSSSVTSPNTQMFKGQLEMSDLGYIKVNDKMETSVPGVFAAGEAADPHFRQVVTSAGMGAAAAIQATRFLEAEEVKTVAEKNCDDIGVFFVCADTGVKIMSFCTSNRVGFRIECDKLYFACHFG